MKSLPVVKAGATLSYILLILALKPAILPAQSEKIETGVFPVEQRLVREGDFAVRLLTSLGLRSAEDYLTAESTLGDLGIAPRNGWIADYPVTPDIIGELLNSVMKAADSGDIKLGKAKARRKFEELCTDSGIPVEPAPYAGKMATAGRKRWNLQDTVSVTGYFAAVGPPVITYYDPPAEYSHLYCLVPYPFSSHGVSFPGFFILKQFHRTVFENGRVEFVSNNFHVFRNHRVFRIDPIARFKGNTYGGIGVPKGRGFKKTGIRGNGKRVFNGPQPLVRP